jgi:bacterial/archaeal transporter family-2 protein
MNPLIGMIAAAGAGVLLIFQPLMNAILARAIGSPFGATLVSLIVSLTGAILMVAITGRGTMTRETLSTVPWWVFLAGLVGLIFVLAGVTIAPVTGALVFIVCVIAGQLVGALVADHFGLFGIAVRHVSVGRLLGLALVLGGAVLAQRG